jgi:hypothetical protein
LINGEINTLIALLFLLPDLCINASDSKLIRKENRTDGREAVSIEIYNGFVHVDIGFYYFA